MCWSKRSSEDVSPVLTTTFAPAESSSVEYTTVYCRYPSVECSEDQYNNYCSHNGRCCEHEAASTRYCVCFSDYTGEYCQNQDIDPWVMGSKEANTTIGIAVGVGAIFVFVLTAFLVFAVITYVRHRRNRNNRNNSPNRNNSQDLAGNQLGPVPQGSCENGNNVEGIASTELEMMLPSDSNHNSTKLS